MDIVEGVDHGPQLARGEEVPDGHPSLFPRLLLGLPVLRHRGRLREYESRHMHAPHPRPHLSRPDKHPTRGVTSDGGFAQAGGREELDGGRHGGVVLGGCELLLHLPWQQGAVFVRGALHVIEHVQGELGLGVRLHAPALGRGRDGGAFLPAGDHAHEEQEHVDNPANLCMLLIEQPYGPEARVEAQ